MLKAKSSLDYTNLFSPNEHIKKDRIIPEILNNSKLKLYFINRF